MKMNEVVHQTLDNKMEYYESEKFILHGLLEKSTILQNSSNGKHFHSHERFQNIPNKNNCRFIKFDISEFYPSISL